MRLELKEENGAVWDFAKLAAEGTHCIGLEDQKEQKSYDALEKLLDGKRPDIRLSVLEDGEIYHLPEDVVPGSAQKAFEKELSLHLLDADRADGILSGEQSWFDVGTVIRFLESVAKCEELSKIRRARFLEIAGGENSGQLAFLADCMQRQKHNLIAAANHHLTELTAGRYRLGSQKSEFFLLDMHTGESFLYTEAAVNLCFFASVALAVAYSEEKQPVFPCFLRAKRFHSSDGIDIFAVRSYFYRLAKNTKS